MTVAKDDNQDGLGVIGGVFVAAVAEGEAEDDSAERQSVETVSLANGWVGRIAGWLIWFIIAAMNVATLTFLGLGIDSD